jgi:hypothetical protein
VKERLLSGGPDEVLSAVNASEVAIVILALCLALDTPGCRFRDCFPLFHDDLHSLGTFTQMVRSKRRVSFGMFVVSPYSEKAAVSTCEKSGGITRGGELFAGKV